uniref:Vesicular glutamate transporter 2 n=1 Tax=Lygus hesperus TaxID=30085 RepID=A0A0A9X8L0_LYGHE
MGFECVCGVRHIQILLLVICGMVEYSMLLSMRISIFLLNWETVSNYTLFDDPFRQAVRHYTTEQKMILINGWFVLAFAGALISGYLTVLVNLKYLLLGIIASITVLTYVIPVTVVNTNYDMILAVILFTGLVHGMKDPAIIAIIARWTPRTELGRCVSLVFSSPTLANIIVILLFSFLNESPSSWTSIFYLMGNSGILWCVSWYAFGSPNPNKCFYVSSKERAMLSKSIATSETNKKLNISWPAVFKSLPFYGVLISKVLTTWIFRIMLFSFFFQGYMFARGLKYSVKVFGTVILIMALIPAVQFLVGTIGDKVITHKKYPSRYVRKTFNSIALWGECVCCLLIGYTTPVTWDNAMYIMFCHLGCMEYPGCLCSFFDVDRKASGLLFGLVNFVALIPLAYLTNYSFPVLITADPLKFESNWKGKYEPIWLSGAFACFIANFFYIILATDETNPMVPMEENPQIDVKK